MSFRGVLAMIVRARISRAPGLGGAARSAEKTGVRNQNEC